MKILSITKLADESGYIIEGKRNQMGMIQNTRTFEDNFAALDKLHRGAFAFLAFHPAADKHVIEYINTGSLGSDAGSHILVLFLNGQDIPNTPRELQSTDPLFGVTLSQQEHPAYELASKFFLEEARPQLPGLVFFDALASPTHSIYVLINGSDKEQIKLLCRKAFDLANQVTTKHTDDDTKLWQLDFDKFAGKLTEFGIPYRRAGEKGVRAAAFIATAWIKKNSGTIVAVIPKLLGLDAKSK